MYTNNSNIGIFDVMDTIQGADIYNSEYLHKLATVTPDDTGISINKFVGRLDLATRYIYENTSVNMQGVLAIYNKISIDKDTEWKDLKILNTNTVMDLFTGV